MSFADKIKSYEQEINLLMGSTRMQEEEIESFLKNITENKVVESAKYVQSMEQQSNVSREITEETEKKQNQEQIKIEQVVIGGENGEF